MSKYRVFSGLYFPVFAQNIGIDRVDLHIHALKSKSQYFPLQQTNREKSNMLLTALIIKLIMRKNSKYFHWKLFSLKLSEFGD